MRAVLMSETGAPDVLRLSDVEDPAPGESEVLVRVRAASVNPIDWKFRMGAIPKELPAVLGIDVSGVVESSRAEGFAEGDEVFGIATSGSYAQLAIAPGSTLAPKPAGVTHEQAAALPVAAMTAWQALFDRGALQAGQRAVISGAAGGVGHFAVQLAARAGALVTGIGSERNRDFVLGLGADAYVDYAREDVAAAARGADLGFDAVGGGSALSLLGAVRDGGAIVTITGSLAEAAAGRAVRVESLVMSPNALQLAELARLVAAGELRVEIAETFALEDIARAHELSETGHTRGKIVVSVA